MSDARKLLQLLTTVIGASLQRCKHHGPNQYRFCHLFGFLTRCIKEFQRVLARAIATMLQSSWSGLHNFDFQRPRRWRRVERSIAGHAG
jgi:hypothetical protein